MFEKVAFKECWYRGQPATDIDLTVAIAYWGEVQIELIRQRNQVPSIYTDFAAQGRDRAAAHGRHEREPGRRPCAPGKRAASRPCSTARPRACASPTSTPTTIPGGMIELIEATPKARAFFERIRAAARDWDGGGAVGGGVSPVEARAFRHARCGSRVAGSA